MTYYHQELLKIAEGHFPGQPVIERCRMAKELIDKQFCTGINLDYIARRMFVSKFHFIRQFHRCYGRTPHRYITERRMREAKTMLGAGHGVTETCYGLGYSSVTSFSTLFRKYTGYSPSVWREMRNFR